MGVYERNVNEMKLKCNNCNRNVEIVTTMKHLKNFRNAKNGNLGTILKLEILKWGRIMRNVGKEAIRSVKKIPTVFKRTYDGGVGEGKITSEITPGMEWVMAGEGEATEKVDGAACAIIGGEFYKRYDAKRGKKPPAGAIPCEEKPDPYTGHWPHWVKVDWKDKGDRWFVAAYENTPWYREDGTYEAVGLHFQNNPYGLDADFLERHGRIKVKDFPRTFDGMREWLRVNNVEGIVVWKDGKPQCKIRRRDFGFPWPVKEGK